MNGNGGDAVAILGGVRLPFQRSGGTYERLIAFDLARAVIAAGLGRMGLDGDELDGIVMGSVLQNPSTSNVARDAALAAGVPHSVPASTVTMACISANRAIANAALEIRNGAGLVLAGGVESLSDIPLRLGKEASRRLMRARKAKSSRDYLALVRGLGPSDLLPRSPAIAEYSTGETMGESADRLAAAFGVSRAQQDAYALRSHQRAAQATREGMLNDEIAPYAPPPEFELVAVDDTFREDSSLEKLARLPA